MGQRSRYPRTKIQKKREAVRSNVARVLTPLSKHANQVANAEKPQDEENGVSGIRTHETDLTRLHDFQSCSFDQLGHHSKQRIVLLETNRDNG